MSGRGGASTLNVSGYGVDPVRGGPRVRRETHAKERTQVRGRAYLRGERGNRMRGSHVYRVLLFSKLFKFKKNLKKKKKKHEGSEASVSRLKHAYRARISSWGLIGGP